MKTPRPQACARLLKKRLRQSFFLRILRNFKNTFLRNTPGDCLLSIFSKMLQHRWGSNNTFWGITKLLNDAKSEPKNEMLNPTLFTVSKQWSSAKEFWQQYRPFFKKNTTSQCRISSSLKSYIPGKHQIYYSFCLNLKGTCPLDQESIVRTKNPHNLF